MAMSFLAACGSNEQAGSSVDTSGTTIAPSPTGGADANAPDSLLRAPGPQTPDRASGGGARSQP
jgi:hypothetical protein